MKKNKKRQDAKLFDKFFRAWTESKGSLEEFARLVNLGAPPGWKFERKTVRVGCQPALRMDKQGRVGARLMAFIEIDNIEDPTLFQSALMSYEEMLRLVMPNGTDRMAATLGVMESVFEHAIKLRRGEPIPGENEPTVQ